MTRSAPAVALACALAACAAACSRVETTTEPAYYYDPYEGEPAFPNTRPKLPLSPRAVLGLTSDNGSDTVTVIDLSAGRVLGSRPVGRDPIDLDGPHHLAADRAQGVVFVALAYPAPAIAPGPHAAHGSSPRDGFVQKLALEDLRPLGEVRVRPNPGDIVLSADRKRLVVSHYDLALALDTKKTVEERRASLAVVDAGAILPEGSPPPTFITTCVLPHGVALSTDARFAYVACYGEDAVAVVDLDAPDTAPELVPLGGSLSGGSPLLGPYTAVLSPSGKRIAVGNTESKDVRLFDPVRRTVSATVLPTLGAPQFAAWSPDETRLLVPVQGPDGVTVLDVGSGKVVSSRSFDVQSCRLPHEVVLSPDALTAYVVCEGDHEKPSHVLALDAATLETKASYSVGVYPDRLVVLAP
jgi:DNA-binding beta-propeller fold protein YncE